MSAESLSGTLQETLSIFERKGIPLSTKEVTESLDIGRRSTYDRLKQLVDLGYLETKKVGASGRVWWRTTGHSSKNHEGNNSTLNTYPDNPSDAQHIDQRSGNGEVALDWETIGNQVISDVLSKTSTGMFILDHEFHIAWINDVTEEFFGLDRDAILGREKRAVIDDQIESVMANPAEFVETVRATYEDNTYVEQFECQITPDPATGREKRWLEHWSMPITEGPFSGGRIELYTDITERKRRAQELTETNALLDSMLEVQQDAIYAFDGTGNFIEWNSSFREVTGYTDEEIESMQPLDFIAEESAEKAMDAISSVVQDGENVAVEILIETKDGEQIPYEVTGSPLFDDDGNIVGLTGAGRDISDRKATEERLRKQRDEIADEIDEILNRIGDGFYGLDDTYRFTYANDRAVDLLERSEETLLGKQIWDVIPELKDTELEAAFRTALEEQESTEIEFYDDERETWFELSVFPSSSGLSVYFRDICERKERERDLERYETVTETASEVIVSIDTSSCIRDINPAVSEMFGYEPAELLDEPLTDLMPERLRDNHLEAIQEYLATGEETLDWNYIELPGLHADGSEFALAVSFSEYEHHGQRYFTGIIRDISERKQLEAELDEIYGRITDAFYALDSNFNFTHINQRAEELIDFTDEGLVGKNVWETFEWAADSKIREEYERAMEEQVPTSFEIYYPEPLAEWFEINAYPSETGLSVYFHQITERIEQEQQLEKQVREQEVITELGRIALEDANLDVLMAKASRLVAEVLQNDYCKVLDLDGETDQLLLRQGVGWQDGIVGEATVSAVEADSQAAYTLQNTGPIVVENLETETRFSGPDLLTSHDVKSGVSVVIGSHENPWGILGTHDRKEKTFTEQDVSFVQAVANILATAIDRHEREAALRHQQEELVTLNNLNGVVSEITEAVIRKSTREEIEQAVCEALSKSDSYEFAWMAEVNEHSEMLEPRVAVDTQGYEQEISVSLDPAEPGSSGPGVTAIREQQTQVVRDVFADPDFEPWREPAKKYGFTSVASIPVVHEGSVYGVIGVYADRPKAFDTPEKEVISRIGEIAGHAIASVERQQALMSDEVVELSFQHDRFFDEIGIDSHIGGQITIDDVVPRPDDGYLLYGTATEDARDSLEEFKSVIPSAENITLHSETGDTTYELQVTEPPFISTLASLGGSIEEAIIEDGSLRVTVHLAPGADSKQLIEKVKEEYPGMEMVSRQQITRDRDSASAVHNTFTESLTDRQRTALEAAYYSGFFEWPRDSSGEDVAESLDLAAPTFHQHLRKAQNKVIGSVLEGER